MDLQKSLFFSLDKNDSQGLGGGSVGKVALGPASQEYSVANKSPCVKVEGQDQYLRLSSDLHIHTSTHAQRSYVHKNLKNIDDMVFLQEEFCCQKLFFFLKKKCSFPLAEKN